MQRRMSLEVLISGKAAVADEALEWLMRCSSGGGHRDRQDRNENDYCCADNASVI